MEENKRKPVHFDEDLFLVGDTYYYRGTPLGSKNRREVSLDIKNGAKQKDVLAAKKEKLAALEVKGPRAGRNAFSTVSAAYLEAREKLALDPESLSPSSIRECRNLIKRHFQPYAGNFRVENIDQDWFDDYCVFKHQAGYNLVNHQKVMNHFLKWCVRKKYLRHRPELTIPEEAQKEHRERVVLTDEEIKRLIEACEPKVLLYVMMYLLMGMRNMEICKLRWDQIDFEKRALQIHKKSNRRRKERAVPINSMVLKFLKQWAKTKRNDYVFPSSRYNGKKEHMDPAGGIRKAWLNALTKAKIERAITPHDLRATFETFMHTNNDFTDTQREKMAGAKIDVQKNIYVKMQVEHLRGLEESVQVDGLEKILGGKLRGKSTSKAPSKKLTICNKGRKTNG